VSVLNRTLATALVVGCVSSLAGPAGAVPLAASQSLRDAATPAVETVRWRGRGFGFGLAAAAIIGGAIAASRPYYGYGYYGYGYPAYGYAYGPSYSYAPAYYGYAYAYPRYYYGYPRLRYRSAYYGRW
jgi:hypothetical protein